MHDKTILRDLAKRYLELCSRDIQAVRRDLWRRHNSLQRTLPPIYTRAEAWDEMPESRCECEDEFLQPFETFFRHCLFWDSLNDDSIFEPWVSIGSRYKCEGWGIGGLIGSTRLMPQEPGGAFKVDYPIRKLEDIENVRPPWHEIDEEGTAEDVARLTDILGDIITINVDRGPAYRNWTADLSSDLGYLRGMENFMIDMIDNPEWLHRLLTIMRDGVMRTQETVEAAGNWGLAMHQNQAMPYAEELDDPQPNVNGVKRRDLWTFVAAQEFTGVSPDFHEEFLLQYQRPIIDQFGLVAYGCCEDLTQKIDMLRQIPKLRRIAVSPAADVAKCAGQIRRDYVFSYRPNPTEMVAYGFDEERIRTVLRRDLEVCREHDCCVDITLKDVETVQGDRNRVRRWVEITREVIDEVMG
ncbi:MAG: hypothetical protein QGF67_05070 [Lentisphaeria bacterium]|jgi:hypothetical protein|nr:hypothetical protein [Lentisphaeria bacterium]MDP7740788.1 hypothetical protein [Lentisphaeria bacterium]